MLIIDVEGTKLEVHPESDSRCTREAVVALGVSIEEFYVAVEAELLKLFPPAVVSRLGRHEWLFLKNAVLLNDMRRDNLTPIDWIGLLFMGEKWLDLPAIVREVVDSTIYGVDMIVRHTTDCGALSMWVYFSALLDKLDRLRDIEEVAHLLPFSLEKEALSLLPWKKYILKENASFANHIIEVEGNRRGMRLKNNCWVVCGEGLPEIVSEGLNEWHRGRWLWREGANMSVKNKVMTFLEKRRAIHGQAEPVRVERIPEVIKLRLSTGRAS